jgi:cytidyltransferase-like protein
MRLDAAMNTALLFGTFDNLHEGHRSMLNDARMRADRLVVSLPPDDMVVALKGKSPMLPWSERKAALLESGLADEVIEGDREPGMYHVIETVKPDLIIIGYDQYELAADLARYLESTAQRIPIVRLAAYQPEIYKSSLINPV